MAGVYLPGYYGRQISNQWCDGNIYEWQLQWDTGWQDNPVEFYVGPIKMFPGAKAPVTAKAHDYAIRSFESKVVLPGQRSLTGEVVDKESFSFRWQVKNTGEKQLRQTTLLVKCEAVSDVPCPTDFPFSRTIGPILSEASGEYVGITVLAPASGQNTASWPWLILIMPLRKPIKTVTAFILNLPIASRKSSVMKSC